MHDRLHAACLAAMLLIAWPQIASAQKEPVPTAYEAALQEPPAEETVLPADSLLQKPAGDSAPFQEAALQTPIPGSSLGDPDIDARFNAMQAEINALKEHHATQGITSDRARSSDLPPLGSNVPRPSALEGPTYPTIKVTGFFQEDTAFFAQDAANIAALGNVQDQTGFRRTRLAATGDVAQDVSYMLEMDFSFPGRPSFMDVWLDVHSVPMLGNVRVGQWRQPFGLDNLTSVRELTFLERPLSFAFTPFRQTGIGFYNYNEDKTMSWFGSIYKFPTDFFADSTGDKGYGAAGRLTRLLIDEDDGRRILHVGGEYTITRPSTGTIQYRVQPEFGGAFTGATGTSFSVPFVANTGLLSAPTSNLFNAEVAGVLGSFHFQSEATYAAVDQLSGPTVTFPSVYAQAAYILTGEVRPYNRNNAVLGRIKPDRPTGKGGLGAWEVASRWSYIDLNAANIAGGRVNDYTFGLNWYLNSFTKFQLNYIRSMLAGTPAGRSDLNVVAIRAQLDF